MSLSISGWVSGLSPRRQGVVLLGCATLLVILNLLVAQTGRYYPLLFPLAGAVVPLAVFMLLSGHGTQDFRDRQVARGRLILLLFVMSLGVAAGAYANHAMFALPG